MLKKGFSLIELMIYLMLLCMLSLFVSRFCINWYRTFFTELVAARHMQQAVTALTLMQHDLEMAPAQQHEWYVMEPNLLIVNTQNYTLGWLVQDGTLYRAVGNYNSKTNSWKTRKKQQAAKGIAQFNTTVNRHEPTQSIISVTVQLINDHKPDPLMLQRKIVLYNRESL